MPTQAHARPARRAVCTLYEIDPRNGETIEIFYADIPGAQSFGARARCSLDVPSGPFIVCLDAYHDATRLLRERAGH